MTAPANNFSLRISTSVKSGQQPIGDLTRDAIDWSREIWLQGGYWLGSFQLRPQRNTQFAKLSDLVDFAYTMRMAHVEEYAPFKTWEGFIASMELNDTPGNEALDVTVAGYIHTANWRYCTAGAGASVNLTARISDVIGTDCEYLDVLQMSTNTTQVPNEAELEMRAWDELLRLTEIGDGDGNLYRIYAGNDRKMFYRVMDNEPLYYVKGGLSRRFDMTLMWNYVYGVYISPTGDVENMEPGSNQKSIDTYGRREESLKANNLPTGAAEAYRDTYLNEYQWPVARVAGSNSALTVYSAAGGQAMSPWQVQPGVYRDIAWPVAQHENESWFQDGRDFLVDRVEASADGVQLRTWLFDETEQIETQAANKANVWDRWERVRQSVLSRPLDAPDWGDIRRGNDPRDLRD